MTHYLKQIALLAGVAALGFALPVQATDAQSAQAAKPPGVSTGHHLALEIAAMLERDYLEPQTGREYARTLRENAVAKKYDALEGIALANEITSDLAHVRADNHLRVRFQTQMPRRSAENMPSGLMPGHRPPRPAAIEQPGWIAPGIAFIRFNEFPDDAAVTDRVRRYMQDHASAKTIIFDLRTNRGGGVDQMDVIFPWLYAHPTRLVTMESKPNADMPPEPPSMRAVKAPDGRQAFEHWVTPSASTNLHSAKIFVLTAPRTGSAGEHLAAAMKWSGRATLIGTSTAGANHFGSIRKLDSGFSIFLPEGRTYNPLTGADWEGVGIDPDIKTTPDMALPVPLEKAGLSAQQAARVSATYQPKGSMEKPTMLAPLQ